MESVHDLEYEAGKAFKMNEVPYHKGDLVDVSNLPDHKIKQFLDQRLIRPRVLDSHTQPAEPDPPS